MLARTFVEAGASTTRDDRTEFQGMIAAATADERSGDIILVHSLSRLFRSALHDMQYKAQLQHHKLRIVSITQAFGDDPASELACGMLGIVRRLSQRRKLQACASHDDRKRRPWVLERQTPPLGYQTASARRAKGKERKRLEFDRMGAAAEKRHLHLLTGHVICGCGRDGCGEGMTTATGKGGTTAATPATVA